MSTKNLLSIEIEKGFNALDKMEIGSDTHKNAVNELSMLVDREIELIKVEKEFDDKEAIRKNETELRLKQMDDDRKDRLIRNCLTGVSIVSGIGVTVWGALKSWKFEETGTITSTAGRKFIGNLFNRK